MLASVAHKFLFGDTTCVLAHVHIFTRLPAVLSWAYVVSFIQDTENAAE